MWGMEWPPTTVEDIKIQCNHCQLHVHWGGRWECHHSMLDINICSPSFYKKSDHYQTNNWLPMVMANDKWSNIEALHEKAIRGTKIKEGAPIVDYLGMFCGFMPPLCKPTWALLWKEGNWRNLTWAPLGTCWQNCPWGIMYTPEDTNKIFYFQFGRELRSK